MAWVRFKKRFNWRAPTGGYLAFDADRVYSVKAECAADAIAAGKAEPHKTPRRGQGVAPAAPAEPNGAADGARSEGG